VGRSDNETRRLAAGRRASKFFQIFPIRLYLLLRNVAAVCLAIVLCTNCKPDLALFRDVINSCGFFICLSLAVHVASAAEFGLEQGLFPSSAGLVMQRKECHMPNLPNDSAPAKKRGSWLNRRALLLGAASAAGAAAIPNRALQAAAWKPSGPVRVLIGYPAGGAVDTVVRLVGEGVRRTTGAVVIGEVRSGAYGVIAAQAAALAPPDGYTLASAIMGMMSVLPAIPGSRMAIDVDRDLTPVINLAGSAMAVVARPDAPFDDIDGLISHARSRPGELTYASSGSGSINHVAAAYIAREVGIEMLHVPYRGGSPATMDILAGRVDLMVANVAEVAAMVEEGKTKALGITASHASPMMPKAPPLALRFAQLDFNNWFGLAGPPNMPADVVEGVADMFATALREPETVRALATRGLEPLGASGSAFAEQIRSDRARWGAVAKNSNIRLE
jgi:tripartite-type tricarboxylate transporter receptor subunit TctC